MKRILVAFLSITLLLSACSNIVETAPPASTPVPGLNNGQNNSITAQSEAFTVFRGFPRIYNKLTDETFESPYSLYVLSEFRLFPFNRQVEWFLPCDGRLLQLSGNISLYSLIGDTFGGDGGRTYFAIPDFVNKSPLPGLTYHICITGAFPDVGPNGFSGSPNGDINYYPIANPDYVTNLFISEIVLAKNADKRVPRYLIPCDGRTLKVNEHQALFALLGNKFGGDAQTTFSVPDLSAVQSPVAGASYYIVAEGIFPPND